MADYEPPDERRDGTGHEEIGEIRVGVAGAITWTVLAFIAGWLLATWQHAHWITTQL